MTRSTTETLRGQLAQLGRENRKLERQRKEYVRKAEKLELAQARIAARKARLLGEIAAGENGGNSEHE